MACPLPLHVFHNTRVKSEDRIAMTLNGEAWKNRGDTTYTSLLDMYGVSDLFSDESMRLYEQSKLDNISQQKELTEYLFSGRMQDKSADNNIVEQIFSEEIQFSKVQRYNRNTNDYTVSILLAEILFVLVFLCILMKWNASRREKRKGHAAEIDF